MKTFAIILAGGLGSRLGYGRPKQLLKIAGKPIMQFAIEAFESHEGIDEIILVINPTLRDHLTDIVSVIQPGKITAIVDGGETRRESAARGIAAISAQDGFVLIHDAVRPFVSRRIINTILTALREYSAVDVAIRPTDTIIGVNDQNLITSIPERDSLRQGQTPQGFRLPIIREAHRRANTDSGVRVTDDCGLVARYRLCDIAVVEGELTNIKITFPQDLFLADRIFQIRGLTLSEQSAPEKLHGQVLAVFGGTRGIGKAIVELAASRGIHAYPSSRSTGVDVSDPASVSDFLERVAAEEGRIDHVVNCAAVLHVGKLSERTAASIRREVEINYLGSLNVAMVALPYLRETQGSIVLFTSSSYTRGRPSYVTYSSTKAAIVNVVQGLAEELTEEGIRINAINPERAATPMRFENFGYEPRETLLDPRDIASTTLAVLLSPVSGMVFDVKIGRPCRDEDGP